MTSPKSQNGRRRQSSRALSASNAPQPPLRLCMPVSQSRARPSAASEATRSAVPSAGRARRRASPTIGGVVDVRVVVVLELEGPAAGREVRPSDSPVAPHGDLLVEQPARRRAAGRVVGGDAGVGQRRSWPGRCPTPATGRPRCAGACSSSTVKRVEPVAAAAFIAGWSSGKPSQVQREQRVHPRRLDAAPRRRRLPGGRGSSARRGRERRDGRTARSGGARSGAARGRAARSARRSC